MGKHSKIVNFILCSLGKFHNDNSDCFIHICGGPSWIIFETLSKLLIVKLDNSMFQNNQICLKMRLHNKRVVYILRGEVHQEFEDRLSQKIWGYFKFGFLSILLDRF